MSWIQAILLGLLQGLTEFIPVSSSGHLKLGQLLFGYEELEKFVLFDLACHLGTLCVLLIFFRKEIRAMFSAERPLLLAIVCGTLPLFPLVIVLKPLKEWMSNPQLLGGFFLLTATALWLGEWLGNRAKPTLNSLSPSDRIGKRQALIIGCSQACAVIPGISRSGLTISMARALGWNRETAVRFSFLLAIPAVLGGIVLESAKALKDPAAVGAIDWTAYGLGFFCAALMGFATLKFLLWLIQKHTLRIFAWYCGILGLGCLLWLS